MGHDQFFTPSWAAQMLVTRYLPNLKPGARVLDPACGDGRFLLALPSNVEGIGVEIDPQVAALARENTSRPIITGDFETVQCLSAVDTVIGNPPFNLEVLKGFLDKSYQLLEYHGRVQFILPVYMFQTPSTVLALHRKWSLSYTLLPRTLFQGLSKPIMWATFIKTRAPVLCPHLFFLYQETHDFEQGLTKAAQEFLTGNKSQANGWKEAVAWALSICGGKATLSQLYHCLESRRPTKTQWWREQIRKVVQQHFQRIGPGEYALKAA